MLAFRQMSRPWNTAQYYYFGERVHHEPLLLWMRPYGSTTPTKQIIRDHESRSQYIMHTRIYLLENVFGGGESIYLWDDFLLLKHACNMVEKLFPPRLQFPAEPALTFFVNTVDPDKLASGEAMRDQPSHCFHSY